MMALFSCSGLFEQSLTKSTDVEFEMAMQSLTEVTNNRNQTMSSREIAELTGKRHDHVLRDVDNILKTLSPELGLGFKSTTYKDSTGREKWMDGSTQRI